FGCIFLIPQPAAAQQLIPVSTFTITGLNSKVASAGLPEGLSKSLVSKLSNAQAAYLRDSRRAAIGLLVAFANEVQAQNGKLIEPSLASQFVSEANKMVTAIQNGYNLGGATVGTEGVILEVTDPNSPAVGTKLTIPPDALSQPTAISMSVPDLRPINSVLTFAGSGIALGPEGLVFTEPAT